MALKLFELEIPALKASKELALIILKSWSLDTIIERIYLRR